jgi:NAD(P)-dependent dehydrogenase (short-subunit alcohol dehydrogenase family)
MITGANSGLGIATAQALAARGGNIIAVCRKMETATRTADTIRASAMAGAVVVPMACDLGSLASIQAFATSYKETGRPLHVLINNAGVLAGSPRRLTADGIESSIGINHVGSAALTLLLLDVLKSSAPARVVMVSSRANYYMNNTAGVDLDDFNSDRGYDCWLRYGQSKLASEYCSASLTQVLSATIAFAFHTQTFCLRKSSSADCKLQTSPALRPVRCTRVR